MRTSAKHRSSVSARAAAALVLQAVFVDQAFAAAALSTVLDRSTLEERDRRLCTEIVYGVLRTAPYLLRRLQDLGKIKQSDHVLVGHLLVAAYQLAFLDRVPQHAAVNEAVSAIGIERGHRVGGFANAILRQLAKQLHEQPVVFAQAVLESCPNWLRKRLVRAVGEDETRELLVPERTPRVYLRFREDVTLPTWLESETERVAPTLPLFRFVAGGDPRKHGEFAAGEFFVQEVGAALVGHLVGARNGERVLDTCAGRGQKSLILAEAVGPTGSVLATDLHEHKLRALQTDALRSGASIDALVWDWTNPPPEAWNGRFDRVLVDVPCSGVGTLRRRPEILRRLGPTDPARLSELQWAIVQNAARALRPSGVLVFASCSVLPEEGPALIERLCAEGQFQLLAPATRADTLLGNPGAPPPAAFHLLPRQHDTDGYFVARLQKSQSRVFAPSPVAGAKT